jgi:hypothetical protein
MTIKTPAATAIDPKIARQPKYCPTNPATSPQLTSAEHVLWDRHASAERTTTHLPLQVLPLLP